MRLEHVSKFKYLRCVLDESGTDEAECRKKLAYDRVDGKAMWRVLQLHGVDGGRLNKVVKGLYVNDKSCVNVVREEDELFGV